MTDPVDPTHLAARFLDLWQESLSAIAADAELLEAMNRSFAAAGFGAAAMAGFTGTYTGRPGFGGFPFAPGAQPSPEHSSPAPSSPAPSPQAPSSQAHPTSATETQDGRSSAGQKPSPGPQSDPQSGTATPPASSDDGVESVAELAERLRILEARLASLASGDARHPRRPASSSRGSSSAGSRRRPSG